jgi:hypothetical protein
MAQFGQKLIDKAKSKLSPKNKWLFDTNALTYVIKDGKKYGKGIKAGKILFGTDSMQFMDDSNPKYGFIIEDYDSLHYMKFTKEKNLYMVDLCGRKMDTKSTDDKNILDPMERLKLSKANRSNLTHKNLLVITIKTIDLGNFGEVQRGDEICVRMQ